jgi:hypothetical protein
LSLQSQSSRYFNIFVPIASFDENVGLIICECPEFGRFLFESAEFGVIKHPPDQKTGGVCAGSFAGV